MLENSITFRGIVPYHETSTASLTVQESQQRVCQYSELMVHESQDVEA